jgi:outer membrane protein with beta-barrel domain
MGGFFRTVAVCLGLGLSAAEASAQMPVQFGVGAGLSVPTGTTNDGLKTGWHGLALIQFKPASSPVGFQIDASYNHLGFDGGGGKDQVIAGTANAVYEFATSAESRFHPYLIGGGGIYNVKAKPDFGLSVSDTKFGINVGAGFNFKASGIGWFVEGRFHNILVSGPDFHYVPITAGVRFGG